MTDPTRRSVLVIAAAAACACAGCPLLTRAAPARASTPVDVGPLKDFAREGVTDRWAASDGFFVVSRGGRVFAVSSHCTHKKVQLVPAKNDDGFKCPRHGSTFDAAGDVTKSPARKPLPRFAVSLKDGHVVVDNSTQFGRGDWNDPKSFIDLETHSCSRSDE